MKILKKSDAVSETARIRKEQIDEGVALALKIDKLRETYLNLQTSFDSYVRDMKSRMEGELDDLKLRIEDAKDDLKELTD